MTVSYKTGKPFPRGARRSPPHKIAAAVPHLVYFAPPPQFTVVPSKLDMWGNETYGDCVSAEEAFAKAWWSVNCGLPETFATAQEVESFANRYGYLNGADLSSVLQTMAQNGMSIGGKIYKDGPANSVDYSNESILQSANSQGPIKIAIDANALPSGAGNQMGWYATGGGNFPNTDHCVSIGGYGSAGYLYDAMKVQLPSGLSSSTPGYHVYTWKTIGFVSHDWLMGTCVEAWLRNPTTPGQAPTPPTPTPTPTPTPPTPVPIPPSGLLQAFGLSLQSTNWSNGLNVGSVAQLLGTMKITQMAGVPVPKELSGMGTPWILLWLIMVFPKVYPVVLADLKMTPPKTWGQIFQDIIPIILGLQNDQYPRRGK